MSTSLIYHALGARTYDHRRVEFRGGGIYFHMEKKKHRRRCVACGSREVSLEGRQSHILRTVPWGKMPVFVVVLLHLLRCRQCGAVRQESRDLADERKSYTRAFGRYVLDLMREMSLLAVAAHLGVSWDLVKAIVAGALERRARQRSWRAVRYLAIDEIALRKGHRYLTVVADLETGQVLYTAEGKGGESLEPMFRRLRQAGAKLEAVAMDMSEAYRQAVGRYWPWPVAIVHDHYHLVANMNEVVDQVRREEQKQQEGEGQRLIKGSRYLLLAGQEKLAQEPDKRSRLEALLQVNETLHRVYLLKEDMRQFWSQGSKKQGRAFIEAWLASAQAMNNRHVSRLAETIRDHVEGILAWYDHRITTGPLEGLNNKIKVLKRRAYGYRDAKFFGLRLLFIHETEFRLTGT